MKTVMIEKIGKQEALSILSNNTINRTIARANVEFIKKEMEGGKFKNNGATIVISDNGVLLDGQHRLTAISELDFSFEMIVVRGLDSEIFTTIDTGRNRNAGDVLSSKKYKYSNHLASACKRILSGFNANRKTGDIGALKYSNDEILSFYTNNKINLDENVEFCSHLYNTETKVITVSVATAMLYLLSIENENKARSFIRELFTGSKEFDSISAQTLRKKILNSKIDGITLDDSHLRAMFIIAFRAYKDGRDLSKLLITNNIQSYTFKQA